MIILSYLLIALSFFSGFNFEEPASVEPQKVSRASVEINLAEMSPRGEAGGYAVPASGASNPWLIGATCSPAGNTASFSWTASYDLYGHAHGLYYIFKLDNLNSSWLDGMWGSPSCGSVINSGDACTVIYTNYYNNVSVNPGHTYQWRVFACSGGSCSNTSPQTFSCPLPPSVTLTANPTVVGFNVSTNLTWSSHRVVAGSCTASSNPAGAWSGIKANSGANEPSGLLKRNTSFLIRCTGNNGAPVQATANVTVQNGTGGSINTCNGRDVVRRNESVCLEYNVGTSAPANCVIRAGNNVIQSALSQSGQFNRTVAGETVFNLYCEEGAHTRELRVRVLPEFQET